MYGRAVCARACQSAPAQYLTDTSCGLLAAREVDDTGWVSELGNTTCNAAARRARFLSWWGHPREGVVAAKRAVGTKSSAHRTQATNGAWRRHCCLRCTRDTAAISTASTFTTSIFTASAASSAAAASILSSTFTAICS